MRAHLRGEIELPTRVVLVPKPLKKPPGRNKHGVSQGEVAARNGFSVRTLQEWEQGRTKPDRAVLAYLNVIARNPDAVAEALSA